MSWKVVIEGINTDMLNYMLSYMGITGFIAAQGEMQVNTTNGVVIVTTKED